MVVGLLSPDFQDPWIDQPQIIVDGDSLIQISVDKLKEAKLMASDI